MKTIKTIGVTLLGLLVAGCETSREHVRLVEEGSSFRDLQQHTYSTDLDASNWGVDLSPNAQFMVYTNQKGGQRDIFYKKVNAKAKSQKTFHTADDSWAALSPDGSKLAFASLRTGNWDIFIMNTHKGKAKRQVTNSPEDEISPSWSPDGKKIAFCRYSRASKQWEIWIFDTSNSSFTNLAPGMNPDYSPTENVIVFQRPNNSKTKVRYSLWTIDDQGLEETNILSSDKEGYTTPSWSPDGQRIVFAVGGDAVIVKEYSESDKGKIFVDKKAKDIYTIMRDGTQLTNLTAHKAADWDPVWSQDGRIYFTSERDKYTNIWSVIPEFVHIEKVNKSEKKIEEK